MRKAGFLFSVSLLLAGCATAKQGDDDAGLSRVDSGVRVDGGGGDDGSVTGDGSVAVDARVIDGSVGPDSSTCTPPIAGGACDTAPQCGCSATQTCSIPAPNFNTTSCVAVGTTPNYANCTGDGQGICMKGSVCVDGTCQPFCDVNADCPGTAFRICAQVSNSAGTPITGFKFCTQQCNPLNPQQDNTEFDPCGPGVNCFPNADRSSSCVGPTSSGAVQGTFCDVAGGGDASLCAPGYACVGNSIGFFDCLRMCRVGMNADCAGLSGSGTRTCFAFSTKQYAGATEIGFCRQASGSP
ncbi:MAG: hypothetical protein IT370_05545 [Deltaproteobacteria bacterium]|nr:hypothetical protein [Deltaproteobacteria bacterium]